MGFRRFYFVEKQEGVTINADQEGRNKLHTSFCSFQLPDRLCVLRKWWAGCDSRLMGSSGWLEKNSLCNTGEEWGNLNPFHTEEQNNCSWGQRPLKAHLFWTLICSFKDGYLFLLSFMIHLRVSEVWLLCRPPCCLKESNLSDKYCLYAVIYPFTIMATSLIGSFMDLLTKEIALCCAHSWQSDKTPLFTFSLAVSHLASQFISIICSHSPLTLRWVINKNTWVFACFVFLSFLSEADSIVYGYLQSHFTQNTAWWHRK